jgi:alpha-L-fucosidase
VAAGSDAQAAPDPAEVIAVAPGDTPAQIIEKAASVVPSPRQLAWQRLELTAFMHFGVNTYNARDWGDGKENPNIFQPEGLDTDQWMRSLKDAGFTQAILTAKHHDGFLLFPSRYSPHSVAASSWRGGQGDVVRSFTDSAHRYGLKVGLYVSPADIHEALPGGRYNNGSAPTARTIPSDPASVVDGRTFRVVADDYNTYFENTLYELLTRYGTVDEVWWDGADAAGSRPRYDWTDWIRIVRTLQPGAVIFQDIDVRWVGTEYGSARQREWSPLPYVGDPATAADAFVPPTTDPNAADKGSDALLGQRNGNGTSRWNFLRWSPAECDAPANPDGYFWAPDKQVRSRAELVDMYYNTVGRNCQLLLNFPPDRNGVFDQKSLDMMNGMGQEIRSTFATDLAAGASAGNDAGTANTSGHDPGRAVDGSLDTSWQPTGTTGGLVLGLGGSRTFDVVNVQEDLNIGMRTRGFAVDAWNGGGWNQIATDTTIGHKKLIRLASPVTTDRIRLRVTSARSNPAIAAVGLYRRPASGTQPGPVRSGLSGKCLDDNGGSNADTTRIQLWDCNGTVAQNWTIAGDGTVRIFGKCMDIYGGGSANGSAMQLYTCHGGPNQKWQASNGTLVNPASGRCLDVPGFNTANGTQLVIWDCNGGANQRWTLP